MQEQSLLAASKVRLNKETSQLERSLSESRAVNLKQQLGICQKEIQKLKDEHTVALNQKEAL